MTKAFALPLLLLLMGLTPPAWAEAPEVTVSRLDGQGVAGQLLRIGPQAISIRSGGEVLELPTTDVQRIDLPAQAAATADGLQVELVGGSRLAADQITGRGDRWQVQLASGPALALPERTVAAVRFRPFSAAAEKSWADARSGELGGDILAISRDDDLELLVGAVVAIDESSVEFEFEGQALPAPRAKLSGLVFLRRDAAADDPRAIEVRTASGSLLRAESVSLDAAAGNDVRISLRGGIELTLPLDALASIDYGGANLRWLDQAEIIASAAEPWLVAADPLRQKMLAPRFISIDGSSADSASGGRPLVFETPGRIELRVPEGYSKLLALARRSEDASVVAPVELTIRSDDRVVWSGTLDAGHGSAEVEVDVEPNKRLAIELRTPSAVPAGARVVFERPRLMQQAPTH